MLKAIIYDFDGVICDSVNVKTDAFATMYAQYGSLIQQRVIDYHLVNGGVSRFEKFKYYQKELLGKADELSDAELKEMSDQFSSIALQKVIDALYIPGADTFLKKMMNKYKQYVCTGTPEKEINIILEKKNLSHLFTDVYGSPATKTTIIQNIKKKYGIASSEMVFLGDAMTDYKAALAENVPFIGLMNDYTTFPEGTNIIRDFNDTKLKSFFL